MSVKCKLAYSAIDRGFRDRQTAQLLSGLTTLERQAFDYYRGKGYRAMNANLRNGLWDAESKNLQSAIYKMPTTTEQLILYRGLSLMPGMKTFADFWRHMELGKRYRAIGFHSFSQDPVHANRFAYPWGSVILVKVPTGSHLMYNEEEKEWIAPHGSFYQFDGALSCGCSKKKAPIVGAVQLDLNLECKKQPRSLYSFTLITPHPPNFSPNYSPPSRRKPSFSAIHPSL